MSNKSASNKSAKADREDIFERVYAVVEQIPVGRVTTYGAIARQIGVGGSARTVGWALNNAINLPERGLPCHRVVNRLGQLTGKAWFGPGVMEALLEGEGVEFIDENTINLEKHYWEPD